MNLKNAAFPRLALGSIKGFCVVIFYLFYNNAWINIANIAWINIASITVELPYGDNRDTVSTKKQIFSSDRVLLRHIYDYSVKFWRLICNPAYSLAL